MSVPADMQRISKPPDSLVLAAFLRGRTLRLELTSDQRWQLRDRDGLIALDVLRHLLGARHVLGCPEDFPLTAGFMQRAANRLGYRVGEKRCRVMVKRLHHVVVLESAGSYRQKYLNSSVRSGFRVALNALTPFVKPATSPTFVHVQSTVGKKEKRKGQNWWEHPLFGDPWKRKPPHLKRRKRPAVTLDALITRGKEKNRLRHA